MSFNAAIIAFVRGEECFARPRINSLAIDSRGYLIADNYFLGDVERVLSSIMHTFDIAGVGEEEKRKFEAMFYERAIDWRKPRGGRL